MIVSDENVEAALAYLNDDPHPLSRARKELTQRENQRREAFAQAFLSSDGSVDARRAKAELDSDCIAAKDAEAEAIMELERHRSRMKAAEMVLEIWRTENANARAAERLR